ncbi:MAG: PcfB family protein [Ruminococcus sp.]|nr:PcfB family protein [Ruminococcus sp.]
MANDFEYGTRKTIALTVQAEKITADIFKLALSEFLDGNSQKKGRMTFRQLENKSPSGLEKIDVNSGNIGDFLDTARKYDVDYALKRDKSTNPPTYHIFFSASKTDNFKKAFAEYADKFNSQISGHGEMSRKQLHKEAEKVANQPKRQQKQREKSRGNMR